MASNRGGSRPGSGFDKFFTEIETEARAAGPEAVQELEAKQLRYRAKAKRGGARPGSGRKPLNAEPMVTRAFVIRRDQADWLADTSEPVSSVSQSELVRRALDKAMKAKR